MLDTLIWLHIDNWQISGILVNMPYSRSKMLRYMKKRYATQIRKYISYMGGKCVKCGSKKRLQFDHIDPKTREFKITDLWSPCHVEKVLKELKKCQLLCFDCHVAKSAKEFSEQRMNTYHHGTIYAWMKRRCDCDTCFLAKRIWYDKRNSLRRKRLLPYASHDPVRVAQQARGDRLKSGKVSVRIGPRTPISRAAGETRQTRSPQK